MRNYDSLPKRLLFRLVAASQRKTAAKARAEALNPRRRLRRPPAKPLRAEPIEVWEAASRSSRLVSVILAGALFGSRLSSQLYGQLFWEPLFSRASSCLLLFWICLRLFSRLFLAKVEVPKHHGVVACEGSMFKSKFANALATMMIGSLGIAAAEGRQ